MDNNQQNSGSQDAEKAVFNSLEELRNFNASRETAGGGTDLQKAAPGEKIENVNSFLKEAFGEEFDSVDKIKSRLSTNIDPQEIEQLKPFIEDARRLKETPQVMEHARYLLEGGTDYVGHWNLINMDVKQMSDFDAVVLHESMRLGKEKGVVEEALRNRYLVDDKHASPAQKADAELQLAEKAISAKAYLEDYQSKARLPEAEKLKMKEQADHVASVDEAGKAWKPLIEKASFDVTIPEENIKFADMDIPFKFDYQPSDEMTAQYRDVFSGLVADLPEKPTQELVEKFANIAKAVTIGLNFNTILTSQLKKATEAIYPKVSEKYYGFRQPGQQQAPGGGGEGQVVVREVRGGIIQN